MEIFLGRCDVVLGILGCGGFVFFWLLVVFGRGYMCTWYLATKISGYFFLAKIVYSNASHNSERKSVASKAFLLKAGTFNYFVLLQGYKDRHFTYTMAPN